MSSPPNPLDHHSPEEVKAAQQAANALMRWAQGGPTEDLGRELHVAADNVLMEHARQELQEALLARQDSETSGGPRSKAR